MSEPGTAPSESETNEPSVEGGNATRSGEARILWRLERAHRRRVAVIVVPAVLGITLLLLVLFLPGLWFGASEKVLFLVYVLLLTSGSGIVLMYLQTGFRAPAQQALDEEHDYKGLRVPEDKTLLGFREDVLQRLASLESTGRTTADQLSPEAASELVRTVQHRIEKAAADQYLDDIRSSVKNQEDIKLVLSSGERLEETIRRLRDELYALRRRGNINLFFGIVVALIGMTLLGYFVLASSGDEEEHVDFIERFLPQVSLVLVVEVFAYFFLRLYSLSLSEVKYFQNEISNVEAKKVALDGAIRIGDEELMRRVIAELAQTERNYILKKGESTVGRGRQSLNEEQNSLLEKLLTGFGRRE